MPGAIGRAETRPAFLLRTAESKHVAASLDFGELSRAATRFGALTTSASCQHLFRHNADSTLSTMSKRMRQTNQLVGRFL
jgi:hypothetical protein